MTTHGERGQSEVGVLVILIATLLVAGTVAGVMFDVTGSFAAEIDRTGQQSNQKVTARLAIIDTTGTVGFSERVHAIELIVRRSAGANDINLSAVTLEFLGAGGVDRLTPASSGALSITALQDDDDSVTGTYPILNSRTDRARLNLSLRTLTAEGGANEPMDPGETARLRLDVVAGGTTVVHLQVPPSLTDDTSVQL